MKNIFYKIKLFIAGFCLLLLGSCSQNILDITPTNAISDASVWSDPSLVNAFVNARYSQISHGWYSESWVSSMCDETWLTWARDTDPINESYSSPSFIGSMNGGHWGENGRRWDNIWNNIANCNIYFDNVGKVAYPDTTVRATLSAQVRFIRAFNFWDLVQRWGGLPIITKSHNLNTVSEIANVKRNTYQECIDFLVSELDKAAAVLPAKYSSGNDYGRATSVAALALKSKILLYAASPLMNDPRSDDPGLLVHYASPQGQAGWQKAADAAQAAITAATSAGYALYNKYPSDVKKNYTQLFLDGGNSEVLFDREGGASSTGTNLGYLDEANGPNGYGGWGGNTPISEFVDDFEMADGSKFSWNSADSITPFQNRDPRLSAYVLCNGDVWQNRTLETFWFTKPDGSQSGGQDTKYGANQWNTSQTAYNMRKYLDETYSYGTWSFKPRNWIWLRLGEQYLNLAEAQYNLGNMAASQAALNVIRDRAHMPEITSTGTQLWNDIVYERRVELAFEEHRYFDVRRWEIAPTVLNRDATGLVIMRKGDGTSTSPYTFSYRPGKVVEHRIFLPKLYWLAIPLDEITKNPNLQQNPGY